MTWTKGVESESIRIPWRFLVDPYIETYLWGFWAVYMLTYPWNAIRGPADVVFWVLSGLFFGFIASFLSAWGTWIFMQSTGFIRFSEGAFSGMGMVVGGFMIAFGFQILFFHLEFTLVRAFSQFGAHSNGVAALLAVGLLVLVTLVSLFRGMRRGLGQLEIDQDWLCVVKGGDQKWALSQLKGFRFRGPERSKGSSRFFVEGRDTRVELSSFRGLNDEEANWLIDWLDMHLASREDLAKDTARPIDEGVPDDLRQLRGMATVEPPKQSEDDSV